MKQLKQVLEGILKGQEDTIANGEKDINAALGIPSFDDFVRNSSGYSVFFPCVDRLKKYNGYRWCPTRSSGLQFSVYYRHTDKKCFITIKLCDEGEKYTSYNAPELKGWNTPEKYIDKPVNYLRKVVISLIEHLAKNPKAFDELLNYNAEIYKDIACRQSYDDGRYMKWRELDELFKIKG